jgi:protein-S-isoprenylcysteine O-methyltransferase Ste14
MTTPSTADERSRGPGIRFPPPLLFLAGFGAAWVLDRRLSFEIDGAGASPTQIAIGAVLLVSGLGLAIWGGQRLVRSRTSIRPDRAARALVADGPYRFTRNPMYVGMTFAYLGIAILTNLAWPVVMLPVVLITMSVAVIRREERHLHETFGGQFEAYCQRVHRWL